MNHYLLPGTIKDEASNPNRGITATRMLIHAMINRGIRRENIEAKVFGGCNSLYRDSDFYKVGERNIAIAFDVLKEFNISVMAQHTGGGQGRKLVFNSSTGKVRMRLLAKSALEINEKINKGFGY